MKNKRSKIFSIITICILMALAVNLKFSSIINATNETTWNISASESDNVTATLNGDTLTISGTGKMKDYADNEKTEWLTSVGNEGINKIIIESGVTNIGSYMAGGLQTLTSVEIPNTVTIIGEGAFIGCSSLESITIPESVLFIKDDAFAASGLTSIEIPYNVISIGSLAFHNFMSSSPLESAKILNGDTILLGKTIGMGPFYQCSCTIEQPERKTTVKTLPTKVKYKCGEDIELDGGVLEINKDGTKEEVPMTDSNIEYIVEDYGLDSGKRDVIVIYTEEGNKYFTYFTIEVYDYIVSISVSDLPKTQYNCGEALNLTNGKIEYVTYTGSTKKVLMTDSKVEVTGYDPNKIGTQTLTVKYTPNTETYQTTFDVEVSAVPFYINVEDGKMPNSKVIGDMNLDGYVTSRDKKALSNLLIGVPEEGIPGRNSDVNGDGKVDMLDMIALERFLNNEAYGFTIDGANEFKVGSELQLSIHKESEKYNIGEITWTSSNNYIATVDKTGKITANSNGKVIIKAENGSLSDEMILYIVNEYGDISKNRDGSVLGKLEGTTLNITGTGEMKDFIRSRWSVYDVNEVKIQNGITNIGERAFDNGFKTLTSIYIPESVTNIGESIFDTDFKGIIIVEKDSYAEQYAKQNKYNYKYSNNNIEELKLSDIKDMEFTGKKLVQNIVITNGTIDLVEGTDYTVEYQNNTNVGIATIVIKGKENYTGLITKTFKITAKDMSKAEVTGIKDETYTGKAVTQNIVVKLDDVELKNGTDYTVEYENNTNAGTATIVIKGKGNYTGLITKTFKITTKDMSKAEVTGIKDEAYTGQPLTQNITVKVNGTELRNGIDYTVEYKNNTKPGKATVVIKGIGSYTGTITKTFIITPKKVSGLKVKEQKTKSIKLNWSKQEGVTGYKVYSYNYKKSKWEYVGKTSSTSYTIKKLKDGTTYKYRVRAYKTIDGKQYFGEYSSNIKTTTKTKTPSIIELTTKNKKATLEWKKISGASGYEIYMATSKKGKYSKVKTIKKGNTTNYTKSKLKKNKKYYFKIRTYRTVDGKKVYSSYSSVESIKIK